MNRIIFRVYTENNQINLAEKSLHYFSRVIRFREPQQA